MALPEPFLSWLCVVLVALWPCCALPQPAALLRCCLLRAGTSRGCQGTPWSPCAGSDALNAGQASRLVSFRASLNPVSCERCRWRGGGRRRWIIPLWLWADSAVALGPFTSSGPCKGYSILDVSPSVSMRSAITKRRDEWPKRRGKIN